MTHAALIEYRAGDIFESGADALVCPVNCVGVMGKGLALEFKRRHPEHCQGYFDACRIGLLVPGGVRTVIGDSLIILFAATKNHWRNPSRLEWVEQALFNIRAHLEPLTPGTLAVPALGCGLGQLPWAEVRPLYEEVLGQSNSPLDGWTVIVYEPA